MASNAKNVSIWLRHHDWNGKVGRVNALTVTGEVSMSPVTKGQSHWRALRARELLIVGETWKTLSIYCEHCDCRWPSTVKGLVAENIQFWTTSERFLTFRNKTISASLNYLWNTLSLQGILALNLRVKRNFLLSNKISLMLNLLVL